MYRQVRPAPVPKEQLLPYMGDFNRYVMAFARREEAHGEGYPLIPRKFLDVGSGREAG